MTKSIAIVLAVAGLLLVGSAAEAQLIGYWNAANPANAGTTVEDLSSSNYDMQLQGTVTDAGNYWSFPGSNTSVIQGTGNESIYDFDTAIGTGANPFTVVAVHDQNVQGDVYPSLVNKDDGNFLGWAMAPRGDNNNVDVYYQPGNNQSRMYERSGTVSGTGTHLVIWHSDGSGTTAGSTTYADGAELTTISYAQNGLNGSILNNEHLRIGGHQATANSTNHVYQGDVFWVQVWAGAEDTLPGGSAADFAALVWNGGQITPLIPEPATMALLGIGGLMVLRRRRSA